MVHSLHFFPPKTSVSAGLPNFPAPLHHSSCRLQAWLRSGLEWKVCPSSGVLLADAGR